MEKGIKWENFRITLPDEYDSSSMFHTQKSRQELLIEIFSQNIFCEHNNHSLEFFYEGSKESLIYGRLFLDKDIMVTSKNKQDPESHSKILPDWHGVWFVLNTDSNFQTISITKNNEFGDIFPKLKSLSKFITERFKDDLEGYGCVILPIPKQGEFWNIVTHSQIYKLSISAYSENFLHGSPQEEAKRTFESVGSRKRTEILENDINPLYLKKTNKSLANVINMLENGVVEVKAYGIHNDNDNKNTLQFDSAGDDNKHALTFTCPEFTVDLVSSSDNVSKGLETIEKYVSNQVYKLPTKKNED